MKHEAMSAAAQIAYFSMEIALDERFSTYSGGLGILSGDTLRSAADLGLPLVAITLAYPNGYFRQSLDADGKQHEAPDKWSPAKLLERVSARVTVTIEGRAVRIAAWHYDVVGVDGHVVPVYLLDTDLDDNTPEDRTITASLYGGDARYRLSQEIVLGIGGGRMLEAVGHRSIQTYHMNEGHAALVALELLERTPGTALASLDAVKPYCVFTTHTPIPAGHDRFDAVLLRSVLGPEPTERLRRLGLIEKGTLNMTHLALRASRFCNAVAMRHGEVSRNMFPGYEISAITNGVHAETWVAPPFAHLFDRTIPEWRRDNYQLRHATGIHLDEFKAAHAEAKLALITEVYERTGVRLAPDVLTLGFARRATGYKRADWLFHDPVRLRALCAKVGRLQVVYGGKAHPHDEPGESRDSSRARSARGAARRDRRRLRAELRHDAGQVHHFGRRHLAQQSAAAARSVRNERHESGAQRHPEFERARRLVDRRLHRGSDGLGNRRKQRREHLRENRTRGAVSRGIA